MNRPEDDYPSPEVEAGARRARWILLGSPIAFLLLLWIGNIFIRWVWQPPIVVQGRVVDTAGKGVPDVLVIVNHLFSANDPNVHWYRPGSWFAPEGSRPGFDCAPYSRVLQTDKQGRYYLRISMHEAFGNQRYPSWGSRTPELKFYKPGWLATYNLYDREMTGWSTPDPFVMRPAPADIATVLQHFDFTSYRNCDLGVSFPEGQEPDYWQRDPSWLRLYKAEYAEVWSLWCGESSQENYQYDDFRSTVGRLDWLAEYLEAYQLGLTRWKYNDFRASESQRFDKNHNVLRQAASSYSWNSDWPYPPTHLRSFQPEEKHALCEALRLENYVTEEHWP